LKHRDFTHHLSASAESGSVNGKGKAESIAWDTPANSDSGVRVCETDDRMGDCPSSHAIDLVDLYILAFAHWIERAEADRFKITPNPTVDKSPLHFRHEAKSQGVNSR
jgi:hypothetical protein